jgi:hypothetical protein
MRHRSCTDARCRSLARSDVFPSLDCRPFSALQRRIQVATIKSQVQYCEESELTTIEIVGPPGPECGPTAGAGRRKFSFTAAGYEAG